MLKAYLDKKDYITIVCDKSGDYKNNSFLLDDAQLQASFLYENETEAIFKADFEVDISKPHHLFLNDKKTLLEIRYFVKDHSFDEMFYYDKDDLGPNYSKEKTIFKLWAPIATRVVLHYELNGETIEKKMTRQDKGVYEICINGDLDGTLYYYKVVNNGIKQQIVDPYAFSSNANGKKSAVVDPDNTFKYQEYNLAALTSINQAIIYELSVRDFSMDESLGIKGAGKFQAFLKNGAKSKDNNPIGMDYLKSLGISHVQLMPIIDFASIDENNIKAKYNWGYDPYCYNTIEGSYSAKPNDPYSRINDAKQMINAFHQANLRVVLDVVFNHTYYYQESIYNQQVPLYFYLMDKDGNLSNGSGCGNDIDTSRKMVQKYFIDMAKRYVSYYQVDGLRLDLMGLLRKDLVEKIYKVCKEINPSFILYGEGWNMPNMLANQQKANLNNAKKLDNVAFFNDYFRDVVSGRATNNKAISKGYLSGNSKLYFDFLKAMRGSVENGCYFDSPLASINYVECHDNYTLFDKLKITNPKNSDEERKRMQLCCLAASIFAQGVPFLHLGSEFLRTKQGVENSYNSRDTINMIRWKDIDKHQDTIKAVKDFIEIRKTFPCFSMQNKKTIFKNIDGQVQNDGCLLISYVYDGTVTLLVFNPQATRQKIYFNGDYKLYANQYGIITQQDMTYTQMYLEPYSFVLMVK